MAAILGLAGWALVCQAQDWRAHDSMAGAGTDGRPNIIVVMTDDLSERHLATAIAAGYMPAFEDTFLSSGVHFVNSFVTNSVCCPSRVSFLTGLYPHNHGVLTNISPFGFPAFDDSTTLATRLQAAGYRTGAVGKYINGYSGAKDLDGDGSIGPGESAYVPPGWEYWQMLVDPLTYRVYGYTVLNGDTGELEEYPSTYRTDVLRKKGLEFILGREGEDAEPFFLWLSLVSPHVERGPGIQASCVITPQRQVFTIRPPPRYAGTAADLPIPRVPSFNEADVSDKPRWLREFVPDPLSEQDIDCVEDAVRDKLESLRSVDDAIGELVAVLRDYGEENTVLIFTSDNGYLEGEHRLVSKTFAYEEAIRVPFYFRDLSGSAPARTVTGAVLNNDIAPSLLELAGAPAGPFDGRSWVSLLDPAPAGTWRKRFLVEHFEDGRAPQSEYRALRVLGETEGVQVEYRPPSAGDLWGGCVADYCEAYVLGLDPFQTQSLHTLPLLSALVTRQSAQIQALATCRGEQCRRAED